MIRTALVCLTLIAALPALAAPLSNQLKNHASPYLAMHAADPVAWQDWNAAVLERARREGKLIYVSIGYFSCHWCHVMQRESYRDATIAALLNQHFIPVKVDRELEPALDARLIAFAESTRGYSGWPLNVFLTPEGYPLFALLYVPPAEFLTAVQNLQALWQKDKMNLTKLARLEAGAADASREGGGRAESGTGAEKPGAPKLDPARVQALAMQARAAALEAADDLQGGFGNQSKFPSVPQLEFLLSEWERTRDDKLKALLLFTLDQMAQGGLHDHLGGGFFRYTVDSGWKTPHFEKMLYDNALLARLYLRAGRVLARPEYRAVARRTLDFMLRELRTPGGTLIASLSAVDDKNVEGGFYLFSQGELEATLTPAELRVTRLAWSMTDAAPFEAGYLPIPGLTASEIAKSLALSPAEVTALLDATQRKLTQRRATRLLPRDTKVLAAWNGLALTALVQAARELDDAGYRASAQSLREELLRTLWDGKALKRSVSAGQAVGAVALEDYAYVAEGLLAYAQSSGKSEDYALARRVTEAAWTRLYGEGGFRLSEKNLLGAQGGQRLMADGPMSSPSAVLLRVSLVLADQLKDQPLKTRALAALNSGYTALEAEPFWHVTHVDTMRAAVGNP